MGSRRRAGRLTLTPVGCLFALVFTCVPVVATLLWPGRGNVTIVRAAMAVAAMLIAWLGVAFLWGADVASEREPGCAWGFGIAILIAWIVAFRASASLERNPIPLQRGRVHVAPQGLEVVYLPGPPFRARLRYGIQSAEKEKFLYVEFACPLPDTAKRIVVASEEWRGKLSVDARMTALDVGAWPYLVRTNDASVASQFLDPPTRALIKRIDQLHSGSFLLDVRPGQMAIRAGARIAEQQRMSEFIGACYQLAAKLKPTSEGVEVVEVAMAAGEEAMCRVCGVKVAEPVVACENCRTPHHADCWAITGKCEVPHLHT